MKQSFPQEPHSYWRDSVNLPTFKPLNQSIKVDVGIVGGGITGITAAYLLTKAGLKVALLEASQLLSGVTGHTTAKITAQHGIIYDELIQHFGKENALLYYQAATEAKDMITNLINEHEIACDFISQDAYIYTNSETELSKLEQEMKAYEQLGIPGDLTETMPLDIPFKQALKMKNQAQFHPLKYLKVLMDEAINLGLDIYEDTTAMDIEYTKHPVIITRDGLRVTCRYIIQASHYPFYDGQGFYPTRLEPERAYIIAAKSKQAYPGGMYINAETPTRSIRYTTVNDEELWIIAGENHKTGQGENMMQHYEALKQFAKQHFDITDDIYHWSAQDYTTLDKVPYIGPVTKNQTNVFIATGYRKWGMTNGTIAAKIITDLITKEASPYQDLFTPSRFKPGPSIKQFIFSNTDVAKHLMKGKMDQKTESLDQLKHDETIITKIDGKRVGIYKDPEGTLYAVNTTCKHLGCEVAWNSADKTWDCPCHGSRYHYTGEVLNGPAKEPLDRVDITETISKNG